MHGRVLDHLPKVLAVTALLPVIAGLGWLTVHVTAKSVDRARNWRLVEARVLDASADEFVTLAYTDQGKPIERPVSKDKGLQSAAAGETLPIHINPTNPSEIEPARPSDLWASPAMLAFFLAAMLGAFVFLWRVKPHEALPRDPLPPPPSTNFQRPEPPRNENAEIVLRQASTAWKANLFWTFLPVLLAISGAGGLREGEWLGAPMLLAGIAGTGWLISQAIRNKSYVLRCNRERIEVADRFRHRTISLRDIATVERVDVRANIEKLNNAGRRFGDPKQFSTLAPIVVYSCKDASGREILRLDKDMEPAAGLQRLIERIHRG